MVAYVIADASHETAMRKRLAILFVFIGGVGAGMLLIGILTRYTDAMCREPLEMQNGIGMAASVAMILIFARVIWRQASSPRILSPQPRTSNRLQGPRS